MKHRTRTRLNIIKQSNKGYIKHNESDKTYILYHVFIEAAYTKYTGKRVKHEYN